MLEFTLGGAWFRWRSLDTASRRLAIASMCLAPIAGHLIGMAAKPINARFGFDVTPYTTVLAVVGIAMAVLSAWLWYRFSLRQDEMFNRVQSWTLGMSGAWTCVVLTVWSVLASVSLAMPVPSAAPAMLFAGALLIFWFVAVRKWAY